MDLPDHTHIRNLTKDDIDAIVQIDEKVLGENRRSYWGRKLASLNSRSSQVSLVAEMEGRVVGFILGDVSGWEFGVPATVGWIDAIGVDPPHQKHGWATALIREMIRRFQTLGVKTVYTLVSWDDWDLLQLFHRIGFSRGDMINLELKI